MTVRHLLTILGGMALLAGCSSGDQPSETNVAQGGESTTSVPPADPCSFVTTEEVAAAIDQKVVRAAADGDTCRYETEDAMASAVEVEIKSSGGRDEMALARRAAESLGTIGEGL